MELISGLAANIVVSTLLWVFATWRRDVSLIDLLWPLFFVLAAWIGFRPANAGTLQWLVLLLVMLWGARLHIHLALRNLGHGEDRRYQAIRDNNNPGFWWKSYFIVFLLQAVLAWLASLSIYSALQNEVWSGVVCFGLALAIIGVSFEAVADWQLSSFKAKPENRGKVMSAGLWRASRHPNYFGECCFWWGIYLVAFSVDWWTLISPVLLTVLLLKVSGVTLLEKDIVERRPEYRQYIAHTPAFVPDFKRFFIGRKS